MGRRSLFELINNAQKDKKDYASEFLTDLIYHIKKMDKENKKPISHAFKPSSIRCSRNAVMQVLGIQPDNSERSNNSIGITEMGSFIHELLQRKILTMSTWEFINVSDFVKDNDDIIVEKPSNFNQNVFETKLASKKWNMHFLVDGLLRKGTEYFILEIKSISSSGFFKLKGIPQKYIDQAISYCVLMNLTSVLFLFVDRDLFNMKTFIYIPTVQEIDNWKVDMRHNIEWVKNQVIPPKPLKANKDFCQYCIYSNYCSTIGRLEYKLGG